MASDINRVILIGRLTRDPELKSTNSGAQFCRFSLASNRNIYNKQTSESRDEVGFFDCMAWGKQSEVIAKYLTKGKKVCVEGNLRWSSWKTAEGKTQSKVEINVEAFQFLDAKGSAGELQPESEPPRSDDDIPF